MNNINIKTELSITKSGNEILRIIFLKLNGAEFRREFYDKKTCKDFINFLKYYNIPITIYHTNYNCSYMNLPF